MLPANMSEIQICNVSLAATGTAAHGPSCCIWLRRTLSIFFENKLAFFLTLILSCTRNSSLSALLSASSTLRLVGHGDKHAQQAIVKAMDSMKSELGRRAPLRLFLPPFPASEQTGGVSADGAASLVAQTAGLLALSRQAPAHAKPWQVPSRTFVLWHAVVACKLLLCKV